MKRVLTVLAAGGAMALALAALPSGATAQPYDGPYGYYGGYYGGGPYGYYGGGPYPYYGGYGAESRTYYYGNRDRRFLGAPGSCTDRTARSRQLQGTC